MALSSYQAGILLVTGMILSWPACDDPSIEPSPFSYPLDLSVSQGDFAVELQWQEVTVSTFEEYIVLRSPDSIPDLQEPEISGQTTLVTRIDQRGESSFADTQFPINESMYYKVYADIGSRFLMSPTMHIDLDLQFLSLRADALSADTKNHSIVCYDRVQRLLFEYDYETEEVLTQHSYTFNVPLIRFGSHNGNEEIYVSNRETSILIVDRETLEPEETIFTTYNVRDFQYADGRFFVARDGPGQSSLAVYRRSDQQLADSEPSTVNNIRNVLHVGAAPDEKIFDLSINQQARFSANGTNITRDFLNLNVVAGSQALSTVRPGTSEMVLSNAGLIIDADLEPVATLQNGNIFFQSLAYNPDGSRLFGSSFNFNQVEITMYDAENNYELIKTIPINFSPLRIFADDEHLHAVGLVFSGGISKTIITKFAYE